MMTSDERYAVIVCLASFYSAGAGEWERAAAALARQDAGERYVYGWWDAPTDAHREAEQARYFKEWQKHHRGA